MSKQLPTCTCCPGTGYRDKSCEVHGDRMLPKFQLGQVVATPGVLHAMEATGETSIQFLSRHQRGDWGECNPHDSQANERALKDGSRIFSIYRLKDRTKIYVITEAVGDDDKRASTCLLLPDEY